MKKKFFLMFILLLGSIPLKAGEWTDTLDAFDKKNPYDVRLEVEYSYLMKKALIDREQECISSETPGSCTQNSILLFKELNYKRIIQVTNLKLSVGLYHDLELFAKFPIVVTDQADYSYQAGINSNNSTINPKSTPNNFLFKPPYKGPNRKGFGDMTVGIKWEPYNQDRDPEEANWLIEFNFQLPTGTVRAGNNTGVGQGIFAMSFITALSREFFGHIEPYFQAHGKLNFPTSSSLFQKYGDTQTLINPGNDLGLKAGIEIIPWQVKAKDQRISIDLGVGADYVFEGREYSELFEALSNSTCNEANGCTVLQQHNSAYTNGITDVSHYAYFKAWSGLIIRPIKYFQIKFYFNYSYEKSHYITNADAGKDLNGDQKINKTSQLDEFNPVYNENYDKIGTRFVVDGVNIFMFNVSIAGTL